MFVKNPVLVPVYKKVLSAFEYRNVIDIADNVVYITAKIPIEYCRDGKIKQDILNLLQYPLLQNKLKLLIKYDIKVEYHYADSIRVKRGA